MASGNPIGLLLSLTYPDTPQISVSDSITVSETVAIYRYPNYSRGKYETLPTTIDDYTTIFSDTEVNDVRTSNDVRVDQASDATDDTAAFLFKTYSPDVPVDQTLSPAWEGQTTEASGTVKLEIYNYSNDAWETLDTEVNPTANTDFFLNGEPTGAWTDYFDLDTNQVVCRVSHKVNNTVFTLKTDRFILTFLAEPAATPRKISKRSDKIKVTESRSVSVQSGGGAPSINKSDSITVSESIKLNRVSFINKSESITVSESINATLVHNINVNDSITLTEAIKATLVSFVNKSESITVTENVVTDLVVRLNVNDSITISENTNVAIASNVNVSDLITITEDLTKTLVSLINVSDSATITESVKLLLTSFVSQSESVTLTENINMTVVSYVNISDSITVTESVSVLLNLLVTVSEDITITDTPSVRILSFINVSDNVTVSENLQVSSGAVAVRKLLAILGVG